MIQRQLLSKSAIWLSFGSLAMVYVVMLIGVYLSSIHQALLCGDWPLCPNGFGLPEPNYLIEYLHRLAVLIAAIIIYITAAYVAKYVKVAQKTAILAAILISIQIIIGMFAVNTRLAPLVVATHLSTGVLLFAMTLMTFLSSYKFTKNAVD